MKEQQPLQPQRISPLLTVLLLLLMVIPLTYFITAGPALGYAYGRYGPTPDLLEDIFRPTVTVADGTPLEEPFRDYVNWWRDLLEPMP